MLFSQRSRLCSFTLGLAIVGLALTPLDLRADAEGHRASVVVNPDRSQLRPLTPTDAYALDGPAFRREVRLGPLDVQKYIEEDALASSGPVRTGVARDAAITAPDGEWQRVEELGWLWSVAIVSDQANAVRLHFADAELPGGAQLFVRDGTGVGQVEGPYDRRWLDGSGAFWTTDIFGDQALVEYFVPTSSEQQPELPFIIDRVMHNYHWMFLGGSGEPREGSCHEDVTCYSQWDNERDATARITYISGPYQYLCSAAMIATETNDETPYLITANHCINTGAEASTLTAYWLYQTSVCDGTPPSLSSVPRSVNASLIATNGFPTGDQTLLLVNGTLPGGVTLGWAGWTTDTIGSFVDCSAIHHPDGAYKRIAFGSTRPHAFGDNTDFVGVVWTSGVYEGGSSGSPLFRDSDRKLIAIASHCIDPHSCSQNPSGPCGDGRFARFYATNAAVPPALYAGSDDALEDNDTCATAVAVTAGSYPDRVVKSTDKDWYKVTVGPCEQLTVTITFGSAWGNIDMDLFDGCGNVIESSHGYGGTESVAVDNLGAEQEYQVKVFLAFDTRNEYDMTVTITSLGNPPQITDQPDSQTVNLGDPVIFEVVATGDGPLSYQWKKDDVDIPGANNSTYTIASAEESDEGDYTVDVFNCGLVTSDVATLTVISLPGDFDGDGDVDLDDFASFAACFNGAFNPPAASCPPGVDADLDNDGDVDLDDFAIFAGNFTGAL